MVNISASYLKYAVGIDVEKITTKPLDQNDICAQSYQEKDKKNISFCAVPTLTSDLFSTLT